MRFVNSVVNEFATAQANEDNEFNISPWFFEVKKNIVLVEIPYCFKMKAYLSNLLMSLLTASLM